jgi:hypothetical protein
MVIRSQSSLLPWLFAIIWANSHLVALVNYPSSFFVTILLSIYTYLLSLLITTTTTTTITTTILLLI